MNVTCNLCFEPYQQFYVSAPDILEGQAHSSPGFGGSRCPCKATGEVENLRRAFGNNFCSDMHPGLRGLAISSNNEPSRPHLRIDERSREGIGYNFVDLIARVDRLTARVVRQAMNMLSALLDRCSVSGETYRSSFRARSIEDKFDMTTHGELSTDPPISSHQIGSLNETNRFSFLVPFLTKDGDTTRRA